MESGSHQLTRIATAYTTSLAFALTFVVALAAGCDLGDALFRAAIVLACAMLAGRLLAPPVIDVVLQAMARDKARREAQLDQESRE